MLYRPEKGGLLVLERGLQAPSQAPLKRGGVSERLQGDLTRENLRRKLEVLLKTSKTPCFSTHKKQKATCNRQQEQKRFLHTSPKKTCLNHPPGGRVIGSIPASAQLQSRTCWLQRLLNGMSPSELPSSIFEVLVQGVGFRDWVQSLGVNPRGGKFRATVLSLEWMLGVSCRRWQTARIPQYFAESQN